MKILFTICGRAGSKGFKNKNLKEMNGIPLVYYTLAVIWIYKERHPGNEVRVALNTDSEVLLEKIKRQRVVTPIWFVERKSELAGDKVAKVDVIRDTYFLAAQNENVDVVVDLDITSPLRTVTDLENVIKEYSNNPDYELVTSVVPARRSPYFNMVEERDGCYRKICKSSFTTRQEAPASYELNASIYAYRPSFLENEIEDTILDHRCGISIMQDYLVLDIDSEEDFGMMEFLHRYYCEQYEGIREVYEMAKKFI